MKKVLVIFAMIMALTMAAWGDIPFNSANAATAATEEVTEEQSADSEEETFVEEEEAVLEDDEIVIDEEEAVDQGDVETQPAE